MALGDATAGWVERRVAGTIALFQVAAGHAERDMKANAPWTDRTGLARAGLSATAAVVRRADSVQISLVLQHGVSYGLWLEKRWAGRYAIVDPTAEALVPRLRGNLDRLWRSTGPAAGPSGTVLPSAGTSPRAGLGGASGVGRGAP